MPRPLLRALPFALAIASLPLASIGCEVSAFGSEPVQLFGGVGPSSGGEAGRCGEPEDARRGREQLADTSGESPCAYRCVFENGVATAPDGTSCSLVEAAADGSLVIDMSRSDAILARVELCEPTVLQLADSAGARHDGADDAAASHDASVLVHGGDLDLFPAHGGNLMASHVAGFVPESAEDACVTRTLELTDSVVYLPDLERGLCGTSMLRIDPPTDEQGRPDSSWHLALGRSLDGALTGAPPPRLELCFL